MNERRERILAIASKEIGYSEKLVNLTRYGDEQTTFICEIIPTPVGWQNLKAKKSKHR